MKTSLLSTSAAALTALAACAPAPGDAPEQGGPGMQPDLSWVKPDFGWHTAAASNVSPVRLMFGEDATDHIMTTITCGERAGMFHIAYFEAAPAHNGLETELVFQSADRVLRLRAEAECPYSQLHQGCVTTAATGETGKLTDVITATTPIRISAAGEGKWYPAPGAKGEAFAAACRNKSQ